MKSSVRCEGLLYVYVCMAINAAIAHHPAHRLTPTITHHVWCWYCLSVQHSLTCTADVVLERLTQRVSALTAGCGPVPAKVQDSEEKDVLAKTKECFAHTSSEWAKHRHSFPFVPLLLYTVPWDFSKVCLFLQSQLLPWLQTWGEGLLSLLVISNRSNSCKYCNIKPCT